MRIFWVFIFLATSFAARSQTVLDAAQTESMIQKNKRVQIVDVRTPEEWAETGVIKGAHRINFNGPDFQAQVGRLNKTKPVIVYCAAGGRSPRAAAQLVKMGFKKVYDYAGGMNDWKAKGKKTVQ